MRFKNLSALLFAMLLFIASASQAQARNYDVQVVLGTAPRYVLAEHGVPNGAPCEWYAYATTVGLSYCAHPGVDLAVSYEPIYAATDGTIEFAGADGYYSPYHVDIRSSDVPFMGEQHIYGHLSEVFVVQGQNVKRGDLIGTTGSAGGWPHLHFERRTAASDDWVAGRAIDPEPVLEWNGK